GSRRGREGYGSRLMLPSKQGRLRARGAFPVSACCTMPGEVAAVAPDCTRPSPDPKPRAPTCEAPCLPHGHPRKEGRHISRRPAGVAGVPVCASQEGAATSGHQLRSSPPVGRSLPIRAPAHGAGTLTPARLPSALRCAGLVRLLSRVLDRSSALECGGREPCQTCVQHCGPCLSLISLATSGDPSNWLPHAASPR